MSVTFWCPAAPRRLVTCQLCDGTGRDWQDPDQACWCAGTPTPGQEQESEAPDLNCGDENARWLLEVAGVEVDQCGTIRVEDIPAVTRSLLRARNVQTVRQTGLREPEEGVGALGARWHAGGTTDEAVRYRLDGLQALLAYAAERGLEVVWG